MQKKPYTFTGDRHLQRITFEGNSRLWRNWLAYCRLLDDIDYGCEFKNGECKVLRQCKRKKQIVSSFGGRSSKCCCEQCDFSKGYINGSDIATLGMRAGPHMKQQILALLDEHFVKPERHLSSEEREAQEAAGFWRKGQGCILPRWLRSQTCQNYNCMDRVMESSLDSSITEKEYLEHCRKVAEHRRASAKKREALRQILRHARLPWGARKAEMIPVRKLRVLARKNDLLKKTTAKKA